jgi:NADH:ubiquinone oxidoreductase subunit 3 (subunit A)
VGDFEVFLITISIIILTTVLYNVLTFFSYKDILRRFGLMKASRKDFYECGFKPQVQRPIKVSIQFLLICVFFLLYDIELVLFQDFLLQGFTIYYY